MNALVRSVAFVVVDHARTQPPHERANLYEGLATLLSLRPPSDEAEFAAQLSRCATAIREAEAAQLQIPLILGEASDVEDPSAGRLEQSPATP